MGLDQWKRFFCPIPSVEISFFYQTSFFMASIIHSSDSIQAIMNIPFYNRHLYEDNPIFQDSDADDRDEFQVKSHNYSKSSYWYAFFNMDITTLIEYMGCAKNEKVSTSWNKYGKWLFINNTETSWVVEAHFQ